MFQVLLDTAEVNTWIVYNMISSMKLGLTEFRKNLAETVVVRKNPEMKDVYKRQVLGMLFVKSL